MVAGMQGGVSAQAFLLPLIIGISMLAFTLTVVISLSPTEVEIREDAALMARISRHPGQPARPAVQPPEPARPQPGRNVTQPGRNVTQPGRNGHQPGLNGHQPGWPDPGQAGPGQPDAGQGAGSSPETSRPATWQQPAPARAGAGRCGACRACRAATIPVSRSPASSPGDVFGGDSGSPKAGMSAEWGTPGDNCDRCDRRGHRGVLLRGRRHGAAVRGQGLRRRRGAAAPAAARPGPPAALAAGIGLDALSFFILALALAFGPLALVQPLAALYAPFALPLIARRQRRLVTAGDAVGAVAVAGGIRHLPRGGHALRRRHRAQPG